LTRRCVCCDQKLISRQFLRSAIGDAQGDVMPQFTPRLIQDMRNALEDVMTRVPPAYVTAAVKVYLAECILKAAAQGHTSYNELVTAAADQIQTAISLFT